jgi:hypothetical protein
MKVNPSQAAAVKTADMQKVKDLFMLGQVGRWKRIQQIENVASIPERSAREFSDNEGVAQHVPVVQK